MDLINLIILDNNLETKLTGIKILEKIRDLNIDIFVIFASANEDLEEKVKSYDRVAWLPKPFALYNLKILIQRFAQFNEHLLDKIIA